MATCCGAVPWHCPSSSQVPQQRQESKAAMAMVVFADEMSRESTVRQMNQNMGSDRFGMVLKI